MKKLFLLLVAGALASGLVVSGAMLACVRAVPTWRAEGPRLREHRLPLRVRVDAPELDGACLVAAAYWNEQVGYPIWDVVVEGDAEVLVDDAPSRREGHTRFEPGKPVRISIRPHTGQDWRAAPLCMHELGHALGLEDDPPDMASVMNPLCAGDLLMDGEAGPEADLPAVQQVRVMRADLDAVRAAYPPPQVL